MHDVTNTSEGYCLFYKSFAVRWCGEKKIFCGAFWRALIQSFKIIASKYSIFLIILLCISHIVELIKQGIFILGYIQPSATFFLHVLTSIKICHILHSIYFQKKIQILSHKLEMIVQWNSICIKYEFIINVSSVSIRFILKYFSYWKRWFTFCAKTLYQQICNINILVYSGQLLKRLWKTGAVLSVYFEKLGKTIVLYWNQWELWKL